MMIFLSYVLALAFPTLEGVLALRLLERTHPVLFRAERWCIGFLLGFSWSAYLLFWAIFFGVPLTLAGFLAVHCTVLALLLLLCYRFFPRFSFPKSPSVPIPSFQDLRSALPRWLLILGFVLVVWTLGKILLGGYEILSIPSYWNDIYASWNMRAKIFYVSQSLLLDLPSTDEFFFGGRVPGYPLAVPFAKVWLALMTGGWSDAIINSVHFLWFIALLTSFFFALLRVARFVWSIFGTYLLVSMPLVLMQGTNAYTDIFMAAHLFLVLSFFYQWMIAEDGDHKRVWLLLLSFTAAAMLFVKNEAMLLYLPPIAILVFLFWIKQYLSGREHVRTLLVFFGFVGALAVPWVSFKLFYGMVFGNATSVSAFSFTPNPDVPESIMNSLFYSGSFLLLFPLFLLLLGLTWRFWTRRVLGFLIAFLFIVFTGEFFIYYLTGVAVEVIRHTAFERGIVHLVPIIVFVSVLILRELFGEADSKIGR